MTSPSLWTREQLGSHSYELLNLEHPEIDQLVMKDMDAGTEVYYDRRWDTAAELVDIIDANPAWLKGLRKNPRCYMRIQCI